MQYQKGSPHSPIFDRQLNGPDAMILTGNDLLVANEFGDSVTELRVR